MESGKITFKLIDDDGDDLPGAWSYEWSGRDPFELAVYAITEASGRAWKWSSRRDSAGLLSARRCRALKTRVSNLLLKSRSAMTAAVIARIVAQETVRPGQKAPDPRAIREILAGNKEADWEAGPHETTPAMMLALRTVLRAAAEGDAGVQVRWGRSD